MKHGGLDLLPANAGSELQR